MAYVRGGSRAYRAHVAPIGRPGLLGSGPRTVRTAVNSMAAKGVRFRACESSHQGLDRSLLHLVRKATTARRESAAVGLIQRKAGRSKWVNMSGRARNLDPSLLVSYRTSTTTTCLGQTRYLSAIRFAKTYSHPIQSSSPLYMPGESNKWHSVAPG